MQTLVAFATVIMVLTAYPLSNYNSITTRANFYYLKKQPHNSELLHTTFIKRAVNQYNINV